MLDATSFRPGSAPGRNFSSGAVLPPQVAQSGLGGRRCWKSFGFIPIIIFIAFFGIGPNVCATPGGLRTLQPLLRITDIRASAASPERCAATRSSLFRSSGKYVPITTPSKKPAKSCGFADRSWSLLSQWAYPTKDLISSAALRASASGTYSMMTRRPKNCCNETVFPNRPVITGSILGARERSIVDLFACSSVSSRWVAIFCCRNASDSFFAPVNPCSRSVNCRDAIPMRVASTVDSSFTALADSAASLALASAFSDSSSADLAFASKDPIIRSDSVSFRCPYGYATISASTAIPNKYKAILSSTLSFVLSSVRCANTSNNTSNAKNTNAVASRMLWTDLTESSEFQSGISLVKYVAVICILSGLFVRKWHHYRNFRAFQLLANSRHFG